MTITESCYERHTGEIREVKINLFFYHLHFYISSYVLSNYRHPTFRTLACFSHPHRPNSIQHRHFTFRPTLRTYNNLCIFAWYIDLINCSFPSFHNRFHFAFPSLPSSAIFGEHFHAVAIILQIMRVILSILCYPNHRNVSGMPDHHHYSIHEYPVPNICCE